MSTPDPVNAPPDPPTVYSTDGHAHYVCPIRGYDCCRMRRGDYGDQLAKDAIDIHVRIHHRWNWLGSNNARV